MKKPLVILKDEGELSGETIGPIALVTRQGSRVDFGWGTATDAQDLADRVAGDLDLV